MLLPAMKKKKMSIEINNCVVVEREWKKRKRRLVQLLVEMLEVKAYRMSLGGLL